MRFAQTYDAHITGLEIMPSGRGFAMADTHCQIVLWGSTAKMHFTEFPIPIETADVPAPHKHVDWSVDSPLSTVGMPFYREALLSGWPNSLTHQTGALRQRLSLHLS